MMQSYRATMMLNKSPSSSVLRSTARCAAQRRGSSGSSSTTGLASAAEELVKAARAHVDTSAAGRDTVVGLAKLKETVDSKTNTIVTSINRLNANVVLASKRHELGWAIENADINSFAYYKKSDGNYYGASEDSAGFVKDVLLTFREEKGRYIRDCSLDESSYRMYSQDD
jgi:hypothetical protein